MTRLRHIMLGGLAALAIGGVAGSAFAEEAADFKNRLGGATVGLPLGALPGPGLYTGLETAYLGWSGSTYGNQGTGAGTTHVNAIAQAVPLLFVPGWNFLGASYSMSAVAAFYEANQLTVTPGSNSLLAGTAVGIVYVVANPTLNPINLSWNLGNGWFVAAGLNVQVPIGTNNSNLTNPDYWTIEPTFAISYLANNWVLSANMFYQFNLASGGTCCSGVAGLIPAAAQNGFVNGQEFFLDMTAAYKFGKWEIGPVAYLLAQTTSDRPGGGFTCALANVVSPSTCGMERDFAIGGLIGYDFGPVDLQVWVTDSVFHQDTIDGFNVWTRIGFKLWGTLLLK